MTVIICLFSASIAFAVTAAATGWLVSRGRNRWLVDQPNRRSLHDRPISRAGGIAIIAGFVAALGFAMVMGASGQGYGWVFVGALLVCGVSVLDDMRGGVSPALRIVFHLGAAGCVVLAGLSAEWITLPGGVLDVGTVAGKVFTVLFVVWVINLYNFMDGMDGFAGGMATIGFTTLTIFFAERGSMMLVVVGAAAAAASLGFLLFNFPPAKIFMGDLGSTFLGYLSAVVMLRAERSGLVPLWISVLVFSPFIVDATFTIVRRLVAGERPWRPHLEHCYQRLVRLGWGHRKTVVCEYGLMLACAASAALALRGTPSIQAALLGSWVIAYIALVAAVARLERRTWT